MSCHFILYVCIVCICVYVYVCMYVFCIYIYITPLTLDLATLTSLYNVYLLTSVDVVPLMKTAGVVKNSGHCIYSIGLKCF